MRATLFIPASLLAIAGLIGNYIAHGKLDSLRATATDERRAVSQLRQDLQAVPAPVVGTETDGAAADFDADAWIARFAAEDKSSGDSKHKLLPEMLEQLEDCFDSDLEGLMAQLKEPGATDGETMPFFVAALLYAEREPEKALAFAIEHKIGNEFLEGAFASLAKKDLRKAWDWLSEQQAASTIHLGPMLRLRHTLARHMADRDPAMLAEFALSLPEKRSLINTLNAGFVLRDSKKSRAAWSALHEHPDLSPEQGVNVDEAYLGYLARVEGATAAAALLEGEMAYLDESARAQSIVKIAQWAQHHDATTAADWLVAYAEAPLLARALPGLVKQWTHTDFNAAGEWLGKLPPSPTRDAAVAEYFRFVRHLDAEAAKVWLGTVRDEALRETLLEEQKAGNVSK